MIYLEVDLGQLSNGKSKELAGVCQVVEEFLDFLWDIVQLAIYFAELINVGNQIVQDAVDSHDVVGQQLGEKRQQDFWEIP